MPEAVLESTVAKSQKKVVTDKWWEKSVAPPATLPTAHSKIMQTINFNLGSFDDNNRTFTAVASTPVVDRQGDIVDQATWDLTNFKANPVIPWAHDYFSPPVARAVEIGVINGVLQFTYQAPPAGMYEFADLIWDFYRNQYMFAFSVGFIPNDREGNTFTDCELLEISAVVVPANPQALALAYKSGDMDIRHAKQLKSKLETTISNLDEIIELGKNIEDDNSSDKAEVKEAEVSKDAAEKLVKLIEGAVENAMDKITKVTHTEKIGDFEVTDSVELKGAISSDLPLADKGTTWDKGAAVKAVKAWATSDGNIDFSKYKKAFMWVSDGGGDKQGDYKLPFATISDGKPVAVWNAVKAIMGVLNGARGGVNGVDRNAVYTQVKKYYKKFDEEVPPLKSLDDLADEVETKDAKGAVADEIAEEEAFKQKRENMHSVMNVFWAFCDVYFDAETPVDNFKGLLDETISIFQKISSGTYQPADGDDDDGDEAVSVVVSSAARSIEGDPEKLLADFFTKLLTDETQDKDNTLMGKKDMAEGGTGAAVVPTEFARKVKAVSDYLLETKAMLDKHTEALHGHADTMNAHADALAEQAKAAEPHAYVLKEIVDVISNRTGDGGKSGDPDGDGISDADHLDNNGGNNALDEQNYPADSSLTRLSGEPSETKDATDKSKGEVKSEDKPTDGADQKKDAVVEESKASEEEKVVEKTEEQPAEGTQDETPAEGKATTEEKSTAEETELTDDTEVDPDNLSDEEAAEIVRAVNEALTKAK